MSQLSRTPAANAAATATQSLSTLLANLRASMQRLTNAWAHRVSTANKSYLAAVMGPSLTRSCRESAEWSISEGVENDSELMTLVKRARSKAPELQTAIEDHIRWVSREIEGGICREICAWQPDFTLDPDRVDDAVDHLAAGSLEFNKDVVDLEDQVAEAQRLLKEMEKGLTHRNSASSVIRAKVIQSYEDQMKHILSEAAKLVFCDKAQA